MPTNAELSVILKLKDQVSKELEGVKGKFRHFTDTIKENWVAVAAGATMAIMAFRKVAQGIKDLVITAEAHELALKKARVAVENVGVSWKNAGPAIESFADEMQKMTTYGNTETIKLVQDLVPYTKDVSKAMEGAKIAMDMASAGLFDVNTASKYVGMAMQGNVEMLGRYVGELRANSNEQLKNMTAAEKTEYALNLLKKLYGGMAENEVKTFAGSTKQLQNNFSDLKRELGNFIIKSDEGREIINSLSNVFSSLAENLKKYRDEQEQLRKIGKEVDLQEQLEILIKKRDELRKGGPWGQAMWGKEPDKEIRVLNSAIDELKEKLKELNTIRREAELEPEKGLAGDPEKVQEMLDLNFENILANLELIKEAKNLASEDEQTRLQAYYDWLNSNDLLTTEQKIALLNKQAEAYKNAGIDEVKVEQWKAKEKEKINKTEQEAQAKAIKARWDAIVSLSQSSVSILRSAAKLSGESWLEAAAVMIEGLASVAKAIATLKAIAAPTPWQKAVAIAEVAAAIMSTLVALKGIEDAKKKLSEATVGELNIPKMQEGGIVTKPTLLIAGEKKKEAIIPLDRMPQVTRAPITNHFNFSVTITGTNDEIREKLEDPDFWNATIGRNITKILNEQNALVLGSIWDK